MPSVYELARIKSAEILLNPSTEPTAQDKIRKHKTAQRKAYRNEHLEHEHAYNKAYRESHHDQIVQHRIDTREARADRWQRYYKEHHAEILAKQKENRQKKIATNDQKYRENQRRRQSKHLAKIKQDPERYKAYKEHRNELRRARYKCKKTLTQQSPPLSPGTQNLNPAQSK